MGFSSTKNSIPRFIPSQRIKGSDKELFIINYEGSVIEIQRSSNLYEPIIVRIDGKMLETVPSKQNKEIEFSTADGKHNLQVWNERVENTLIPKIFVKDGIAIVIDGVPVQNTLADPISRFNSGKAFIWLLTILLFVKAFIVPLSSNQLLIQDETKLYLFINIILFILSLSAALTFQLNPIRAVMIGLFASIIELAEYIFAITMLKEISIVVILFTILRLSILASIIFSFRNLKLILSFSDKENQIISDKSPKKIKRFTFSVKYIVISVLFLTVLGSFYFVVNEIIKRSNEPSIERDSSLEFRTDLKLPELIPYRIGDKWGYVNRRGERVIESKYSSVEFFSTNNSLRIENNELVGIIDKNGKEIIPCTYADIKELSDKDYFIAKKKDRNWGIINDKNEIIIPFSYKKIEKHSSKDLFVVHKENTAGVIDITGRIVIPFLYKNLEFSNKFIIAVRENPDKVEYGLLNFEGSILMPFQGWELRSDNMLNDSLLIASKEQILFLSVLNDFVSETTERIIDLNGNTILPKKSKVNERNVFTYLDHLTKTDTKDYILISYTEYSIDLFTYTRKKGIINSKADIIIPFEYDEIGSGYKVSFNEQYNAVKKNDLYGVINRYNRIILPINYEYASVEKPGDEFYFIVKDKRKNKTGLLKAPKYYDLASSEVVIPFDYDWIIINDKNNNWITVVNNNRRGAVDFNNNLIVPLKYIGGLYLSEGLAATKYVDPDTLNRVLNSNMIKALSYLEEIHKSLIMSSGWDGIYRNPDYKYLKYSTLELMNILTDSLARKTYYFDNYKYLKRFENYEEFALEIILGDWRRVLPGKWGYFNEKGELVLDFIYDDAESFEHGLAKVKVNNKWGVINKNGKVVLPIKYDEDELEKVDGYDLFKVSRNKNSLLSKGTFGFIDINGVEYFKD